MVHVSYLGKSPAPGRRLTAVSLVTHVSTVIVEITPPNAVDTVAVAAAVLVAQTAVL